MKRTAADYTNAIVVRDMRYDLHTVISRHLGFESNARRAKKLADDENKRIKASGKSEYCYARKELRDPYPRS